MKNLGKCLWWDYKDGRGIIIDASGSEYYVDSSVLRDTKFLRPGNRVNFIIKLLGNTLCAQEVELEKEPCEAGDCQTCCQHDERDHGICLDCGHEEAPGEAIDRAMDSIEDR